MLGYLKKGLFYFCVVIIIFTGQAIFDSKSVRGNAPAIDTLTIDGQNAMKLVDKGKGPAIIYFWAEWCGICEMMHEPISQILKLYPGVTIAVKSGSKPELKQYMRQQNLVWPVVNDPEGMIAKKYKINGVPNVLILDDKGDIVLSVSGYSSEIGLRFRVWLIGFFGKQM